MRFWGLCFVFHKKYKDMFSTTFWTSIFVGYLTILFSVFTNKHGSRTFSTKQYLVQSLNDINQCKRDSTGQ